MGQGTGAQVGIILENPGMGHENPGMGHKNPSRARLVCSPAMNQLQTNLDGSCDGLIGNSSKLIYASFHKAMLTAAAWMSWRVVGTAAYLK